MMRMTWDSCDFKNLLYSFYIFYLGFLFILSYVVTHEICNVRLVEDSRSQVCSWPARDLIRSLR